MVQRNDIVIWSTPALNYTSLEKLHLCTGEYVTKENMYQHVSPMYGLVFSIRHCVIMELFSASSTVLLQDHFTASVANIPLP